MWRSIINQTRDIETRMNKTTRRFFRNVNDADSEVSRLVREFGLADARDKTTLLPDEGTMPHVFYIDPNKVLARYKIDKTTKEKEFRDTFE